MARRYYPHKSVLFISTRIQEGLPLTASHVMNYIVWGVLAKAAKLHRVRVCGFVVMANHLHFLIVVEDPQAVKHWIGYIKTELSHAINKLLGRRQRSVWVAGSDAPIILDYEKVLEKFKYIYANPATADLIDSIDEYPGVSSWEMFLSGECEKTCKRVPRPVIAQIDGNALSINEQKRIVERFERELKEKHTFRLEPFAWVDSFCELSREDIPWLRQEVINGVRELEQVAREERKANNNFVVGATALRRQVMLKPYVPEKFGKQMVCLSTIKELRGQFTSHFKELCAVAKSVYEAWKQGDLTKAMPPGMLAPRLPELASALPLQT